jgi:hypothetical protein
MDMPGQDKDFAWRYDLEEEAFVCAIISMAQAVHLWDGPDLTYQELLRDNPHRAYVIAIEYRILKIVDRFKSLNILDRMFSYAEFPIKTSAGSIFRDQWIRIINDVLLVRLTSIRDCCFFFIAEIFEMDSAPRKVNLKNLKKHIQDRAIVDALTEIGDAARDIRDERDRHLHRGEERPILGELDQIFEAMARRECGAEFKAYDSDAEGRRIELELPAMHTRAISLTRAEYHQNGDRLLALTRKLFGLTEPEFERRWAKKRDVAKDVRDWERSSVD